MTDEKDPPDEKKKKKSKAVARKKASSKKKAVPAKKKLASFRPTPVKKKTGGSKSEKLVVGGQEEVIAEMRARSQEIESLEAEQKVAASDLFETCASERLAAEKKGRFHKTCVVGGTDDVDGALVMFKDRYKKLSLDDGEQLREGLGEQPFETLVRRVFSVKARDGVTLAEVKEQLGDAYEAVEALFDIEENFVLAKDFMERRAGLRPALTQDANDFLDSVTEHSQYAPSLNLK